MYATAWQRNGRTLIVATHSHRRLAIADLDSARLLRLIQLPSACVMSYDLSCDGAQIVTGYDGPRYIDIWSLDRGIRVGQYKKAAAARVRFDANSRHVLTWASDQCYVVSTATNTWTRLSKGEDLYGSYLDSESNTMFVPVGEVPSLYRIQFEPVAIERVEMPHPSILYTIRKSPIACVFTLLYEDGRIECRDGLFGSLIWSRQHVEQEITSNGSFSGDGRYFALNVGALHQCWVLDVATGEITHKLDKIGCGIDPRSPLPGALILCSSGVILNAESGEISPGVSSIDWWTKAGMPLPDPL